MMNNDYMNGYNMCIEDTINIIQSTLGKQVDIYSSIGQSLYTIRLEILKLTQYSQPKFNSKWHTNLCSQNVTEVCKDDIRTEFYPDGVSK